MQNPSENVTRQHFAYFWDQRLPYAVKLEIERRTSTLLEWDTGQTHPLVCLVRQRRDDRLELRLEAFDAAWAHSTRCAWMEPRGHPTNSISWLGSRTSTSRGILAKWKFATGERYDVMVQKALEFEAKQATKTNDPAAIAAAPRRCSTHLGQANGTGAPWAIPKGICTIEIEIENGVLVKHKTGERQNIETYSTREGMLKFLRSYFLFDACKDTHPQRAVGSGSLEIHRLPAERNRIDRCSAAQNALMATARRRRMLPIMADNAGVDLIHR
jgi:hypothetical protein